MLNKAVNTISNIAKTIGKGVSSIGKAITGIVTNPRKAINSGIRTIQQSGRTAARSAAEAVADFSAAVSKGYKSAKQYFSSFDSYVSYRTKQIKETIQKVLCVTAVTALVSGKITWERTKLNIQNKFDLPFDINIEYTGELKDFAQSGIGIAGTGVVTVGSALGNMFSVSISKTDSGNTNSSEGDRGSSVPVKEKTTASNGLDYQSNPKHTPGQPGNNPKAGTEPKNSLDLFEESVPSTTKPDQRYTYDESTGTLHRFFNDGNGTWHWSGSTNQGNNSLKGTDVPQGLMINICLKFFRTRYIIARIVSSIRANP